MYAAVYAAVSAAFPTRIATRPFVSAVELELLDLMAATQKS